MCDKASPIAGALKAAKPATVADAVTVAEAEAKKAAEEKAKAEEAAAKAKAEAVTKKAADEKAERNKKEARRKKGKGEKRRMVRLETKQAAVTAQLVTPAAADAKHSKGRLRNGPPGWFKKWSPATPSYWWDDDIMLRAEGLPSNTRHFHISNV